MNRAGVNHGSQGWTSIKVRPATKQLLIDERDRRQQAYENGASTKLLRGEVATLDEIICEVLAEAADKRQRSNRKKSRRQLATAVQ